MSRCTDAALHGLMLHQNYRGTIVLFHMDFGSVGQCRCLLAAARAASFAPVTKDQEVAHVSAGSGHLQGRDACLAEQLSKVLASHRACDSVGSKVRLDSQGVV